MRKIVLKSLLLVGVASGLVGCAKEEPPITNKDESTIIKNAKKVDEYLKKEDYKSIAYSYIYGLKEGLASYESVTKGTVSAKVLFFDYDIEFSSTIIKRGSTFFNKDHSTSPLINVDNEFYMVNKDKVLVSRDLKQYDVYTMEDYHKLSYTADQFTIMGYVFNDESIRSAVVLSDKENEVSIRYTLDNELATNLVKTDLKNNGGLSEYPKFNSINLTLSLTKDFKPISYGLEAIYEASKPFLGTSTVTQKCETTFAHINEDVAIPNEEFYSNKLGEKPSELVLDPERKIKDGLLDALKALDFKNGVKVTGDLQLDLAALKCVLNLDTSIAFDISKLNGDMLYDIFRLNIGAEGNGEFNGIVNLIQSFAKDSLGEYASLLNGFKGINVTYDGNGSLILTPYNEEGNVYTVFKIKLTDIIDGALKKINLYNLLMNANNDLVKFTKEGDDKNYTVSVLLNENTINSIKEGINKIFLDEKYSILKMMLAYEDFDSLDIKINVKEGKIDSLEGSLNYIKKVEEQNVKTTIAALTLKVTEGELDFTSGVSNAIELEKAYNEILSLKDKINFLTNNVFASRAYASSLEEAIEEFNKLSTIQQGFFDSSTLDSLRSKLEQVNNVLEFLPKFFKFDLTKLDNKTRVELSEIYKLNNLNDSLLEAEIGKENLETLKSLMDNLDYSSIDNLLARIESDDETTWNISENDLKEIKFLLELADSNFSVSLNIMLKLTTCKVSMDMDTFKSKINNL